MPPPEYDLHAVVERFSGEDTFQFGLASAESSFYVRMDYGNKRRCQIAVLAGTPDAINSGNGPFLIDGKKHDVLIEVRRYRVRLLLDGKAALDYQGDVARLSRRATDHQPENMFLTASSSFRVHKLEIMPVSETKPAK